MTKSLPLFRSAKRDELQELVLKRHDGERWVRAPGTFTCDELPDREAVRARFGGGRYEIIGRDDDGGTARTRFVVQGEPRPLFDAPTEKAKSAEQTHATPRGAREAVIFRLLDEGCELVDIVERTEIDARTVRGIFEEWMKPLGNSADVAARRAEILRRRQGAMEREWEATWSSTSGTGSGSM